LKFDKREKNYNKHTGKIMTPIRTNPILLLAGVVFLSLSSISCDVQKISNSTEIANAETSNMQKSKPSLLLYRLTYDQTTASFSTRVPAGPKIAEGEETLMLKDYERVQKSITIDNSGSISIVTEWLEGNAGMNMPEET
jgi:hypothetical protein